MCVCVCVFIEFIYLLIYLFHCYLHAKALLEALVYMIIWCNYNVLDVVNVPVFYLVANYGIVRNDILPGDNKDFPIELN